MENEDFNPHNHGDPRQRGRGRRQAGWRRGSGHQYTGPSRSPSYQVAAAGRTMGVSNNQEHSAFNSAIHMQQNLPGYQNAGPHFQPNGSSYAEVPSQFHPGAGPYMQAGYQQEQYRQNYIQGNGAFQQLSGSAQQPSMGYPSDYAPVAGHSGLGCQPSAQPFGISHPTQQWAAQHNPLALAQTYRAPSNIGLNSSTPAVPHGTAGGSMYNQISPAVSAPTQSGTMYNGAGPGNVAGHMRHGHEPQIRHRSGGEEWGRGRYEQQRNGGGPKVRSSLSAPGRSSIRKQGEGAEGNMEADHTKTHGGGQDGNAGDGENSEPVVDQDYISILNQLEQKGKVCTDIKYEFRKGPNVRGRPSNWICAFSAKITGTGTGSSDGVSSLLAEGEGRKRSEAKQRAARAGYQQLRERLQEDLGEDTLKTENSLKRLTLEGKETPESKGKDVFNAWSVLVQMFQKGMLSHMPDLFLSVGKTGRQHQCTIVVHQAEVGRIVMSERAETRKSAKLLSASRVLEQLNKSNVKGIQDYLSELLASKEKQERERNEEITEAARQAVSLTDDEASEGAKDDFMAVDTSLKLPDGFTIVIATTTSECNEWIVEHVLPGSDIGVFLDSWTARTGFRGFDASFATPERHDPNVLPNPVLCLSSKNSGLVLRAENCSSGKPYVVDGFWIPKSVEDVLQHKKIGKYGCFVDDASMRLYKLCGFRVNSVYDVSMYAYGITGARSPEHNRIFWSLAELSKHWLGKELMPVSEPSVWTNTTVLPNGKNLSLAQRDVVPPAVLSAYVCICLGQEINGFADKRIEELCTSAPEFCELAERLMQTPS